MKKEEYERLIKKCYSISKTSYVCPIKIDKIINENILLIGLQLFWGKDSNGAYKMVFKSKFSFNINNIPTEISKEEFLKKYENLIMKEQEKSIVDFFSTLKKSDIENKHATVYYSSPLKMNKTYLNEGIKQENPMTGKVVKYKAIEFNYGDTFKEAVLKENPDYEFKGQSASYEKVKDSDILLSGKNGLYLPVLPLHSESTYKVLSEDGNLNPIEFEDLKQYLPPHKERPQGIPVINQLLVSRISKIESDINYWISEEIKRRN
jgi:hypothetical protein